MPLSLEFLIIFALILANGFFAAAEIAILTSRRNRLEQWKSRSPAARAALELAGQPGRFLSTVQVGITLVGTFTSVFSGATIARYLADRLARSSQPMLAEHSESLALGAVVLGVTFFTLVLGELVPKQLALRNAERFARLVALPMRALQTLARPAVVLMEMSTNFVLAILRSRPVPERAVSIEDIEHLMRTGMRQGVLDTEEQRVARRALRLGDHTVREIMRPRHEVDALDADTPSDEVIGAVAMAGFSRLPVHEGDLDHVIGFVYTKDLLLRQHMGWPIELRKLVRPALLVPETLKIDKLLELFRKHRTQMAMVLDEFGGTEGLVTMEDVLEELVGEIHDEHRWDRDQRVVRRDPTSWLVDASISLHDMLEAIGRPEDRELLPQDVNSVGGLVLALLERIPKVGDRATWGALTLEVVDMDGRRLDRVLVSIAPEKHED